MSELEQNFKNAAEMVKSLSEKPDNKKLLELYSLFKQATIGDINTPQPWAVQLEARAKWDAWKSKEGLSKEECMKKYIAYVDTLLYNQ